MHDIVLSLFNSIETILSPKAFDFILHTINTRWNGANRSVKSSQGSTRGPLDPHRPFLCLIGLYNANRDILKLLIISYLRFKILIKHN